MAGRAHIGQSHLLPSPRAQTRSVLSTNAKDTKYFTTRKQCHTRVKSVQSTRWGGCEKALPLQGVAHGSTAGTGARCAGEVGTDPVAAPNQSIVYLYLFRAHTHTHTHTHTGSDANHDYSRFHELFCAEGAWGPALLSPSSAATPGTCPHDGLSLPASAVS